MDGQWIQQDTGVGSKFQIISNEAGQFVGVYLGRYPVPIVRR